MEASFAQILEYNAKGKDDERAKSEDLMAKYLVCKTFPNLALHLILKYHGSQPINASVTQESDYFALKDISK